MPLTELMHYFNDQLQSQARTKSLPKTGFYKVENGYWARFGSLTLGSQFHIIEQKNSTEPLGHYSETIIRSGTGKLLNIDDIFNSLDNTNEIIHLDRLTRTLHSLNYLQQYDGQKKLLALTVQPRHIVSVIAEHGKTFETILSDCGLGAERVLLHTRLLDHTTISHFRNALLSYRSRGYLVGLTLENPEDVDLLNQLHLEPDVIFYSDSNLEQTEISYLRNLLSKDASTVFGKTQRIIVNDEFVRLTGFDGYLNLNKSESRIDITIQQSAG